METNLSRIQTILVLVGLTVAVAWAGMTAMPPLDRDESRFAQASVQMLDSGDYVRISFQDQARHKKPVGIHWLQTASVSLFSSPEAREIWAFRLPSMLGAILAVLATYWAGCVLVGRTAALGGASLLAVTVLLGAESSIAKTDAMLVGCTALAMAALAGLYEVRGRWLGPVFWAAIGLGIIIKGPITPMVAFSAIALLVLIDRRVKWLAPLFWWPGPLLALAIALPWFVAIQLATDGAFIAEALGNDLGPKMVSGHESHGGPTGLHLALLPILIWPGTLFLLPGIVLAIKAFGRPGFVRWDEEHDDDAVYQAAARAAGLRFLVAWALPTWIIFEMMPTKLVHYPLPVYPAIALMAGAAFAALVDRRVPPVSKIVSIVLFAAAGSALVALIGFMPSVFGTGAPGLERELTMVDAMEIARGAPPVLLLTIAGAAAGLVFLPLILWRAPRVLLAAVCVIGVSWHWTARHVVLPNLDGLFLAKTISEELEGLGQHPRMSAAARRPIASTGFTEPSLVFLTSTDTVLAEPDRAAEIAAAEVGRTALVEARVDVAFRRALTQLGATAVRMEEVKGLNYSKGDPVTIYIYRITSAATRPRPEPTPTPERTPQPEGREAALSLPPAGARTQPGP